MRIDWTGLGALRYALLMRLLIFLVLIFATPAGAETLSRAQDRTLMAAAKQVLTSLQIRSFQTGREFCGLLGRDPEGRIIATRPKKGRVDSCIPHEFRNRDVDPLASYHTHGAYEHDADSEVPSYEDLRADIDEGLIGFIATPGGRLWVTIPETQNAEQICGLRCLPQDRFFQKGDWGFIQDAYSLRQLKQRRQLY